MSSVHRPGCVTLLNVLQVVLDQLTFGPAYNLAFMAYTSMVVHSKYHMQFSSALCTAFALTDIQGIAQLQCNASCLATAQCGIVVNCGTVMHAHRRFALIVAGV